MKNKLFILSFMFSFSTSLFANPVEKSPSWKETIYQLAYDIPNFVIENEISIPVYGNYCGPHHGAWDYSVDPIDAVDEACMWHDICYDKNVGGTYLNCACDAQLVEHLSTALMNAEKLPFSAIGIGGAIALWFANSPCDCKDAQMGWVKLFEPGLFEKSNCKA